uniref:Uncharacterized protein n=1 Tax=Panagrolaimus sp. PS1159 TaxID=55785 RepID=A0AC35GTQ0_9BILA
MFKGFKNIKKIFVVFKQIFKNKNNRENHRNRSQTDAETEIVKLKKRGEGRILDILKIRTEKKGTRTMCVDRKQKEIVFIKKLGNKSETFYKQTTVK